ncbi:guanine nucleotide exchange factor MSS4 [Strongylocentrotus purpuratus]|uniref:Guanine nucleotide exchange factor MSS4 n=1 Tax=Strongylocentrotus purpuratus TaxID=7668 RepID=A0A7M7RHH5_STRPU|nr:guanine nucleotide exchange factor MSS4 [Strongylocentrotus purpuratus]|eukprot:XP_796474.3 PREDICTED: guanine nucleotide exchange factor MSS4-like [Strongylocentrotus purpuratus]
MADKGDQAKVATPMDTDAAKDPNQVGGSGEAEPTRDMTELIKDGKNAKSIVCERCNSKILLPGVAEFVTKEIFLPHMKKKSEQQKATDGENLSEHWVVSDMMTFENVGFTNTVGTAKYLICADCEVGPVGWHDVTDKTKYFIALDRVQHK